MGDANFGHLGHSDFEDYDGDGLTNLQEYQIGTDPRNRTLTAII